MSVRPLATTRVPQEVFARNLTFEYFLKKKTVDKDQVYLKSLKNSG
jgi:hypothetical protein